MIRKDAVYSRDEFLERAGLSEETFANAISHGLPVWHFDGCHFISGADWFAFLEDKNPVYKLHKQQTELVVKES